MPLHDGGMATPDPTTHDGMATPDPTVELSDAETPARLGTQRICDWFWLVLSIYFNLFGGQSISNKDGTETNQFQSCPMGSMPINFYRRSQGPMWSPATSGVSTVRTSRRCPRTSCSLAWRGLKMSSRSSPGISTRSTTLQSSSAA